MSGLSLDVSVLNTAHCFFGVVYWLAVRVAGGGRGRATGRPGLRRQAGARRPVEGAASDGFDHFGHLQMKGGAGRTLREQWPECSFSLLSLRCYKTHTDSVKSGLWCEKKKTQSGARTDAFPAAVNLRECLLLLEPSK